MANILRVINSFKNHPNISQLLKAIDNKFPKYDLGANTPFTNQALETATRQGEPTCLYFDEIAAEKLKEIRNLAQEKSNLKRQQKKEDKPIDFVCTGYVDHSGDIMITDISIPAIDIYREQNKNPLTAIYNAIRSKDANIETESYYYDYLRNSNIGSKDKIGTMPVALLGTTRPIINTKDGTEYCQKLSEIARAIIPANVEFDHPIMSGALSVSPNYIVQTPFGNRVADGSLECTLITYDKNTNNTLKPTNLTNVTRCQQIKPDGKLSIVDISKSKQPLEGLPNLSLSKVK